jgi:hypothetical protein
MERVYRAEELDPETLEVLRVAHYNVRLITNGFRYRVQVGQRSWRWRLWPFSGDYEWGWVAVGRRSKEGDEFFPDHYDTEQDAWQAAERHVSDLHKRTMESRAEWRPLHATDVKPVWQLRNVTPKSELARQPV